MNIPFKKAAFFLTATFLSSLSLNAECPNLAQDPLEFRLPEWDARYGTFRCALQLMSERNAKTIVETGTARHGDKNCRGDGCSTVIWGHWAAQNDAHVYSVDINTDSVRNAIEGCQCYADNVTIICDDSIHYLSEFNEPIDMLYLDSFDYEGHNPEPSKQHHLKEIMAVYPMLHKKSIVMIDDCNLPGGGKGGYVIDYLQKRGWTLIRYDYQAILIYE